METKLYAIGNEGRKKQRIGETWRLFGCIHQNNNKEGLFLNRTSTIMTSQPTKRSRSHSCHFRIPVVLGNIPELISDHDSDENAPKRARSMLSHSHTDWVSTYSSALGSLDAFPQEILHDHILPFLTPNPLTFMDLQLTCKALYKFCHSVKVKQSLQLIGDKDCILHGVESKSQAITRLFEFAKCGNLHAEYM